MQISAMYCLLSQIQTNDPRNMKCYTIFSLNISSKNVFIASYLRPTSAITTAFSETTFSSESGAISKSASVKIISLKKKQNVFRIDMPQANYDSLI